MGKVYLISKSEYGGEWQPYGYMENEQEAKQFVKKHNRKYKKYFYWEIQNLKENKDVVCNWIVNRNK